MVVDVPEQVLAGKLLARVQDAREERVAQPHVLLLARLGAELELHRVAVEVHVFVVQRRDPVRLVLPLVLLVPDADQRLVHEPDRGREHLVTRQAIEREVGLDTEPQPGERRPERAHAVELGGVAHRAERAGGTGTASAPLASRPVARM